MEHSCFGAPAFGNHLLQTVPLWEPLHPKPSMSFGEYPDTLVLVACYLTLLPQRVSASQINLLLHLPKRAPPKQKMESEALIWGDKLTQRGLSFFGFHGALPEERNLGQKF
ncbi:hypothetical protein JHK85_044879 [Glycine max]|nr:hypothetical protein JHK85_044879 [Glycine max]